MIDRMHIALDHDLVSCDRVLLRGIAVEQGFISRDRMLSSLEPDLVSWIACYRELLSRSSCSGTRSRVTW